MAGDSREREGCVPAYILLCHAGRLLDSTVEILSAPLVKAVARRHPGVELRLLGAFSGYLQQWLDDGAVDLTLLYNLESTASIFVTPLLHESLWAVAPPGVPLDADALTWNHVAKQPLVLPVAGHGLRILIDEALHLADAEPTVVCQTNSMLLQKRLVSSASGWTILPASGVAGDVAAGRLNGGPLTVRRGRALPRRRGRLEVGRLLPDTVTHMVALDALHYVFLFGAMDEEQAEELLRPLREDFAGLVRSMVEAGSPAGTDPALKDAYVQKMAAVRQPAGSRAFEALVRWNMEEALRKAKQPITVFAVRDLVTREAIDHLGDRVDVVPVDLGSHHVQVEAPEGTAKLVAGVLAG